MKKFRFTLQTPLNVKLTMEKQLMGELAVCNMRLREFEARQEENYLRQSAHKQSYQDILRDGLNVAELQLWRVTFDADKEQIERQSKVIEQAEGEVARVQKKLRDTMRERKTLEALKEKQLEEYKAAMRAEDAALMDDFLSSRIGAESANPTE